MRQLEFHFGEARARDADTVLVTGAVQSNLVRIAAAAARRLGMEIHIQLEDRVVDGGETYRTSGNLLLDRVLGAVLHAFPEGEDEAAADAAMAVRAETLAADGRKPYVIHSAPGHAPLGGLGYVAAAEEIADQARTLGIGFDAVVCASGSALTHAGLLTGLRALGERAPVLGICVRRDAAGPGCAGGAGGVGAGRDDRLPGRVRCGRRRRLRRGACAGLWQAQRGGARGDGAGGRPRGAAARPGLYGKGDGRADRACAFGPDRSGQPGAVRPHRRPAGALRLCRQPRALALGDAGAVTERGAPDQGKPGAAGGSAALASRKIHSRNARSSGRWREAAVVIRQQRSGASSWRSKSGTSVRFSSSLAINMGRPMAAPSPLAAACTSIE